MNGRSDEDLLAPSLDAERLDVYRLAIEFDRFAAALLKRRGGSLRDQLERASASVALNIAEGAGRRTAAEKTAFYTIARGSATECAAILDLFLARGIACSDAHRTGRGMLLRVVQMLTRLADRPVPHS